MDGTNTVDFSEGDTFGIEVELHEPLNIERSNTTRRETRP
jgi:hypothetical protein